MTALLQCARGLQSSGHTAEAPLAAPVVAPLSGSLSGSWSADPGAGGGRVGSSLAGPTPVTPVSSRASVSRASVSRASVSQPGDGEADDEPAGALSDREREVAALVIEGLTYKQIGGQLFISAKTVEHHVARMRQRLGSTSRGELMAHLRMIVGSS